MDIARTQVEAAIKSSEAAIEAALAAKKSTEISAALHRPFMGLSTVRLLAGGHGFDSWTVAFVLKNFGTLPAIRVGSVIEFFVGDTSFAKREEPTSIQVFPSDEPQIIAQENIANRVEVQTGAKRLRIDFRVTYDAEDGRHFQYRAQVSYNHQRNLFEIDKSETYLLYTVN